MDLKTYIIRRLMLLIPTLLGVSFMIFMILQIFDPIERASVYVRDPKQLRYCLLYTSPSPRDRG